MDRLSGRTAVIFGGAGRIGSCIAEHYVKEDAHVVLVDRDLKKLINLANKIDNIKSNSCSIIQKQISTKKDIKELTQKLEETQRKIDVLVNCPAYIYRSSFLNHPVEEIDKQWDINVRLVFMVSQAIGSLMAKNKSGKIINFSSIGGLSPEKEHIGHCGAKAAIIAMTRVMALELASYNIQVNVIAPGPTETKPFSSDFYLNNPEVLSQIEKKTPAGRIGHPEDHVGLAIFLASNESDWITGQVILSDGGLSLA